MFTPLVGAKGGSRCGKPVTRHAHEVKGHVGEAFLTRDPVEVTCGVCRHLMDGDVHPQGKGWVTRREEG